MKEEDSISAMDKHLLVELPNGDMTIAEKIEPLPRVFIHILTNSIIVQNIMLQLQSDLRVCSRSSPCLMYEV